MNNGNSAQSILLVVAIAAVTSSPASADEPVEQWRLERLAGSNSVLDSAGDLLTFSGGATTGIFAYKIAPDGSVVWESVPFTLPGGHTIASWITVDANDNVIIGGYHEAANGGFMAIKYDSAGNKLWHATALFGAGPEARRVAVDELGDVYVFGETWGGLTGTEPTGHDFLTVKFDAAGNFQWANIANGNGSDEPTGLDVLGGVVAVTGQTNGPYMTVAYDYAGGELWKRFYSDGISGANDVKIGPTGQVIVCGWGTTNGQFPYTGTVFAYDTLGNEAWKLFHNGPAGALDNFLKLAVHENGDVAAVGWTSGGAYQDWSILKIDATGTLLWSQHFGGVTGFSEWGRAVALGPAGEVFVGGNAGPSCNGIGTEGYVVKYASDGTQQWVYQLTCGVRPAQLYVDDQGALWYQGSQTTTRILDSIGTTYCSPAAINSSGSAGVTIASGSSFVSELDLRLTAYQLPPGQFGYFLTSETPGSFVPPGSQGVLCLSSDIGRFNSAAQVLQGPLGSIAVDLTSIPVNPPTAVLSGDTWNFQCWYRDINPGPTSNFTNAVRVTFN